MKPEVLKINPEVEFHTPERCYINELSNRNTDPELSIARARVMPGVTTAWHRLRGVTERYVILEGEGLVEIGGLPGQRVRSGDVVVIPAMCRQRITCLSSSELVFLALCTPRFQQEFYEVVEDPA